MLELIAAAISKDSSSQIFAVQHALDHQGAAVPIQLLRLASASLTCAVLPAIVDRMTSQASLSLELINGAAQDGALALTVCALEEGPSSAVRMQAMLFDRLVPLLVLKVT